MTTRRGFLRSLLQIPDAYTQKTQLDDSWWLYGHQDGEQYGRRFRPSMLSTIAGGSGPSVRNPAMDEVYLATVRKIATAHPGITRTHRLTLNVSQVGWYLWYVEFGSWITCETPHPQGWVGLYSRITVNGKNKQYLQTATKQYYNLTSAIGVDGILQRHYFSGTQHIPVAGSVNIELYGSRSTALANTIINRSDFLEVTAGLCEIANPIV